MLPWLRRGSEGFNIYIQEKAVLNNTHKLAYKEYNLEPVTKKLPKKIEDAKKVTGWMCAKLL